MYILIYTKTFDESYSKIIIGDQEKEKRTQKALSLLRFDPFYPSLKSHKVAQEILEKDGSVGLRETYASFGILTKSKDLPFFFWR